MNVLTTQGRTIIGTLTLGGLKVLYSVIADIRTNVTRPSNNTIDAINDLLDDVEKVQNSDEQ